jgi:hypothetical protein
MIDTRVSLFLQTLQRSDQPMAKKHMPQTNRLTDSLGNHARREPKPTFHGESNRPLIVSFLNWVNPPIGVNMNGIDGAHPNYKVSIMTALNSSSGQIYLIPYAEPIAWNPMSVPSFVQYDLTSSLPGDNTSTELYYETMTVSQGSGNQLAVRSRVFLAPSSMPFTNNGVTTSTASVASPAIIQVSGIVNSFNQVVSVYYEHFLTTDLGPADLFLQQPW